MNSALCALERLNVAGPNNFLDWICCAALGMGGGLVQNIVNPNQRGFAGFVAAAVTGMFCGSVGGLIAYEFQATPGLQWISSATLGVFGFSILQGIFSFLENRKRNNGGRIYIQGGQNIVGDNKVQGGVNQEKKNDE